MNIKKRLQEVSIEKKNLRYRLPVIFAFFFFGDGAFFLSAVVVEGFDTSCG